MRLDRFICKHTEYSQKQSRYLVAGGFVRLNGEVERDGRAEVSGFCRVQLEGRVLQSRKAHYFMLHKPAGYLSATRDPEHPVVTELLPEITEGDLHIAGRLDLHTTGLLILTNDGHWSRRLTAPEQKLPKVYRVETLWPISPDTERVFGQGVYLESEDITTSPAKLECLGRCEARLTIYEGRFHQVKRMFQQVDNMVIALHRESMGAIVLDTELAEGESRELSLEEVASV